MGFICHVVCIEPKSLVWVHNFHFQLSFIFLCCMQYQFKQIYVTIIKYNTSIFDVQQNHTHLHDIINIIAVVGVAAAVYCNDCTLQHWRTVVAALSSAMVVDIQNDECLTAAYHPSSVSLCYYCCCGVVVVVVVVAVVVVVVTESTIT